LEVLSRLKLAVQAARKEVGADEIFDYFRVRYRPEIKNPEDMLDAFVDLLPDDLDNSDALNLSAKEVWELAHEYCIKTNRFSRYELVKILDYAAWRIDMDAAELEYGTYRILFTAPEESMAKVAPDSIGMVKVAIRKGAFYDENSEEFELRLLPDDLCVITGD